MKISEYIKELKKCKNLYGDLEVMVAEDDFHDNLYEVTVCLSLKKDYIIVN